MERRKFTREFKLEAVKLIQERGVTVAQASRDLGVHGTVLRRWVQECVADAQQVLGDLSGPDMHKADADRPTTLRLGLLAAEVSQQELLSEGQLSRLLHLDRVELRRMLDGLQIEGSEADGALLP